MKKVIVCDLDGTLAESKSTLTESMAHVIWQVLETHYFAVISGGGWPQFEKQFLSPLNMSIYSKNDFLKNLLLFPTSGSACWKYTADEWKKVYSNELSIEDREQILNAFKQSIPASGVEIPASSYGDIIEDRGSQITFSGRGQLAPLDVKTVWDPDQNKRRKIIVELQKHIPQYDINIGGMTTIDITQKGINKAYAIRKIEDIVGIKKEDIVFIGDALYPGGNDEKAKEAGVECIQVSGPVETEKILQSLI